MNSIGLRWCDQAHCGNAGPEVDEACKTLSSGLVYTSDRFGPCICACSCLAFGTLVQDGGGSLKAIESFATGDHVMAAGRDLRWSSRPVVYSGGSAPGNQQDFMVMVTYADTGIVVTGDHLFLLAGDLPQLRRADRLTTRDRLLSPTGEAVPITGVHIGSFSGGVHHVAATSKEPPGDGLDGHLLNTNGVVSADYVVQLMGQQGENVGGVDTAGNFELPVIGSAEYLQRFGTACLQVPEIVGRLADGLGLGTLARAVSQGTQYLSDLMDAFTPASASAPRIPDDAHGFLSRAEGRARKDLPKRPLSDVITRESVKYLVQQHRLHYPDITFHVDWTSDDVNAYAWTADGERHVSLQGGLALDQHLGLAGIALVLAHQVAWHQGGDSPDRTDYIAVRDVMRQVWFGEQYGTMTEQGIAQVKALFDAAPAADGTDGRTGDRRVDVYRAAVSLAGIPA
ncbi:hypothetical protein [Thermomonospora cellulosilytica]|uniref:Hint domain-containing protein n=1 Tax=Thermomonospora cellulosilytica TaxID=1411118 RepID=A0A7W3MU37_9ACTN|nr:hypothetical protein [Thermomonospora cellulosilytica]MBA9001940.1 hypothetical protein [Thermomonospora cellulosilytica]